MSDLTMKRAKDLVALSSPEKCRSVFFSSFLLNFQLGFTELCIAGVPNQPVFMRGLSNFLPTQMLWLAFVDRVDCSSYASSSNWLAVFLSVLPHFTFFHFPQVFFNVHRGHRF